MDFLLPGYPQDNPILRGIAAIVAGADPEAAIAARDMALTCASDFALAAMEAVSWLPAGSLLLPGLLDQASLAFERVDAYGQDKLLVQMGEARGRLDCHGLMGLDERWRAIVEAR